MFHLMSIILDPLSYLIDHCGMLVFSTILPLQLVNLVITKLVLVSISIICPFDMNMLTIVSDYVTYTKYSESV